MDFTELMTWILPSIVPLILGVGWHEAAHAYTARWLGDDTPERMGRITLNPLRHIDPFGTVILPILLLIVSKGAFSFGYASTPVDYSRLKRINNKSAIQLVSLAGPVANLLMAIGWAILYAVTRGKTLRQIFAQGRQRFL